MADKAGFPQIPRPVWWGVRMVFRRSGGIKLDEAVLAAELSVQVAAAKQYITELRRVGLLTEDGGATPLAMKWRMDETYREAADQILAEAYPEALMHLAPPGSADRAKVENWFMAQGLGEGTARNKAATYMMIANDDPSNASEPKQATARTQGATRNRVPRTESTREDGRAGAESARRAPARPDAMPLNINVQIHISAEATSDQIETIFASMRKHLYAEPNN